MLPALLTAVLVLAGCSPGDPAADHVYGAPMTELGASQAVLGWNMSVSNLRWDGDHVLVDIDAAPSEEDAPHARPEDIRLGLYGALAHPIEANALGSCRTFAGLHVNPATAPTPDRITGTVCLGPLRDQSQVRGVYVYSPQDRIPETAVAYGAGFPVGVLPTNENDTGLILRTTSVEGFRADGTILTPEALGDPDAFTGNGYMLLGLQLDGLAQRYRDDSAERGGPLMVLAGPTLPPPGLSPACDVYGSSVLVLPDASRDAVQVKASLCTQGEINDALLYASVSLVGTHAALWTADA
ncbi:hypothetical protein [Mycolicibacterium thermoresistibile]|uniref:Lipoprotein n=2 Tax=Mycolicibacterium thermoresistibile TaxID=1797 RepID=G7CC24_MYCT3|nr:hypothetical protein [Mycolicibacterium thermoresistibile]EHI14521.1 hypothetical protein KEK_02596 [Mycolicibacterium thermoresistibile ATCC 19527]MCV7187427.1 hypothetical protein [Mycolicibacterium thermoresistibile]GAT17037.1 conserved protein of unknown function [Mycolicibacterium thermoresistibile]SNW16582.1 Conserved protein of uncharacterised function, possibly exported [Mycolicibacterium thermoresistibile]